MSHLTLDEILAKLDEAGKERFWRENGHLKPQGATQIPTSASKRLESTTVAPAKRIRQSTKGPNKLESAFRSDYIPEMHPELVGLQYNAMTLVIANGVRYTPDWCGWLDGTLTCWEIKGPFAYAGSLEKLKMAARSWPEINFLLAWREQKRFWKVQQILA
jgi:hypothetical protein